MCACSCCVLVLASLALFAFGQANGASKHQVATLASPTTAATAVPTPPTAAQARPQGQPGRFINGAAGVLTAPFRSLVHSDSEWGRRIGYTLLALIVYGFGLGYLARWART